MGIRGIIKDLLFIYLGFMVLKVWLSGGKVTGGMVVVTVIMFFMVAWFMLERVGITGGD